ncbi:hypothetical protein [Enterobacter phage 01_vB_Eclo_IJM]|nr:hypothetical protein [Enterobacter phage 01_vB_Eclo_IJM]
MIKFIEFPGRLVVRGYSRAASVERKSHLLRLKVRKRLLRKLIVCASNLWTLASVLAVWTRRLNN